VAVRCKAFGMKVLYFKRKRDVEFEKSLEIMYVPFEILLKEADSISLHLPLTDETTNLFKRFNVRIYEEDSSAHQPGQRKSGE